MGKEIKVFMLVHHSMVRAGLSKILQAEPDVNIVGYAHKNSEAVKKAVDLRADILVVEDWPHSNNIETLREIRSLLPEVKIMIFSDSIRKNDMSDYLRLGVSGYLNLNATYNEILSTFRATAEGETVLSADALAKVLDELQHNADANKLSDRESQILQMVGDGLSNKDISKELFISEGTVRSHIHHLKEKLELRNRVDIANYNHSHMVFHRSLK